MATSKALALAAALLQSAVFGLFIGTCAHAEPIMPDAIAVIDGDTIRAHGDTYRLVGFDCPEVSHPRRSVSAPPPRENERPR